MRLGLSTVVSHYLEYAIETNAASQTRLMANSRETLSFEASVANTVLSWGQARSSCYWLRVPARLELQELLSCDCERGSQGNPICWIGFHPAQPCYLSSRCMQVRPLPDCPPILLGDQLAYPVQQSSPPSVTCEPKASTIYRLHRPLPQA